MISSIVIAALTAGSMVSAIACSDKTITIQGDGDLEGLGTKCGGVIKGNVVLGKGLSQPDLGGIRSIGGDLTCDGGVNVTSLTAPSLQSIGGDFILKGMRNMNTLNMPKLESVGTLMFQTLPNLSGMTFAPITEAEKVTITDTILNSLEGINLERCDTFDVNNNRYLKEVDVQIESVDTSFSVTFNAKSVVVTLPNMLWSNNLTFRDVGSLKVPSLAAVNGSFGLINCTFTEFSAPNLTTVGQSLAVVSNDRLTNLTFPVLKKITGGLQISNNTDLEAIDGLPKLESVGGAIDLNGAMKTVKLPKVDDVRGGFNIQTTATKFNCDPFQKLKDDNLIQGDITCKFDLQQDQVGGYGQDKGGGKTGGKSSAASSVVLSGVSLIGCAVVSLFYVL